MSLKQDTVTGVLTRHPFIITALMALVVLLGTGMQVAGKGAACAIMVCGYVLIIGYGIYLKRTKRLSDEALIALIFAMGFMVRLGYVLYTDISTRQHDIGVFEEGTYNIMHSGYILYVRDKLSIPDVDVRNFGQFYHPPFHYIVSALFLRLYEKLLPKGMHNYEALQALSMLWAQYAMIMIFRSIKLLGVKKEHHVTAAYIVSAFPAFILMSASINNDMLSVLLFFTGFYFGLKWFKNGSWRYILFSALAVGFGMMTKIAVGIIAFPLGFLFLVKLFKDIADKKEKRGGRTFLQLVSFGVICAPLGLWFQVRNFIKFGVPLTYVLRSDNPYQDLSSYSTVQRLFGFYGFPIEDYYINLGSDGEKDYNIFIAQVKTALFGGENCRDDFLMSMAGYALLIVFLIMIAIAFTGLIYTVITVRKRGTFWEDMSMIVLAVTEVISVITFSLNFPHVCSENFRYSTPLLLCSAVFYLRAGDIKIPGTNKELMPKVTRRLAAAFIVLSILFYTILWTYVKGVVTVTG